MRFLTIPSLLLCAGLAAAQDMPLSEIIKPGESWKEHASTLPATDKAGYRVDAKARSLTLNGKPIKHPLSAPTACVVALGGSQLLVADAGERYVWAFRIEQDGSLGPGDRYCRLRVTGDERRKQFTSPEKYLADPSAMTVDSANRTYVATNLGIQIFDPTGRLCGVIMAPPGRASELYFVADELFALSEGKSYVRKMLASGRK